MDDQQKANMPTKLASGTPLEPRREWSPEMLRFLKEDRPYTDDFEIDRSDLLPLSDKGIFDDEDE